MRPKKSNGIKEENAHTQHIHCNGKSFQKIANETLKSVNFKITKPRLAVINCLENAEKPLSPKNIFDKINEEKESKIDQVSVYRVLDSLTQLGLVHQVYPTGDYVSCHTSCEKKPSHVLVNCLKCNKTEEIQLEWNLIEAILEKIKSSTKFKPIEHMMQINGECAHCQGLE